MLAYSPTWMCAERTSLLKSHPNTCTACCSLYLSLALALCRRWMRECACLRVCMNIKLFNFMILCLHYQQVQKPARSFRFFLFRPFKRAELVRKLDPYSIGKPNSLIFCCGLLRFFFLSLSLAPRAELFHIQFARWCWHSNPKRLYIGALLTLSMVLFNSIFQSWFDSRARSWYQF